MKKNEMNKIGALNKTNASKKSSEKAFEPLHIIAPTVKTWKNRSSKQSLDFIEVQEGCEHVLEEDVGHGASIYSELLDSKKRTNSNFQVILVKNEEDGYRAVQYMAGEHAIERGYDEGAAVNDDFFQFDDEPWTTSSETYEETPMRIPIVTFPEVSSQNSPTNDNGNPFAAFELNMSASKEKNEPAWTECDQESICVTWSAKQAYPFGFGMMEQPFTFDPRERKVLHCFDDNDRVYLVIISEESGMADNQNLTDFLLEYNASFFDLTKSDAEMSEYYKKLFVSAVHAAGYRLSSSVNVDALVKGLNAYANGRPAEHFEKVLNYIKNFVPGDTLEASDFKTLMPKGLYAAMDSNSETNFMTDLYGMDKVRKQILDIVNLMKFNKMRKEKGIKSEYHNVHLFVGAPGTAKTTVANAMADLMFDEGLLSGKRFTSVTGSNLKAEYLGQTSYRVHSLFENYDVIFIDEAYSLAATNQGEVDLYAQEALAQLAVELENHGQDRLVIFAGYGGTGVSAGDNKMKAFIEANPGIKSRINSTIEFPSYSPEDMIKICHKVAESEHYQLPDGADDRILAYFAMRAKKRDFGNGREARSLIERCAMKLSNRLAGMNRDAITDAVMSDITVDDVDKAIADLKSMTEMQLGKTQAKMGF